MPVFFSVALIVADVVPTTWLPKLSVAVDSAAAGVGVPAAGFAIYAAMSAASVARMYGLKTPMPPVPLAIAFRITVGLDPLRMLFVFVVGSGPWHPLVAQANGAPVVVVFWYSAFPRTASAAHAGALAMPRATTMAHGVNFLIRAPPVFRRDVSTEQRRNRTAVWIRPHQADADRGAR